MSPVLNQLLNRSQPPRAVYHYCSMESFIAILDSKRLRMSAALHMNDKAEYQWFARVAADTLARIINPKLDAPSLILGIDSGEIEEPLLTDKHYLAYQLLRDMTQTPINPYSIFVACFSKDGDNLGQWRAYGCNGYGVAIGFHTDKLPIKPREVMYKFEDQTVAVQKFYREVSSFEEDKALRTFASYLRALQPFAKHHRFKDEREWRCVKTVTSDSWATTLGDIRVRAGGNRLVPYTEMEFPIEAVSEVILGPSHPKDELQHNIFAIRRHLANCGGDWQFNHIRPSDIPYRAS